MCDAILPKVPLNPDILRFPPGIVRGVPVLSYSIYFTNVPTLLHGHARTFSSSRLHSLSPCCRVFRSRDQSRRMWKTQRGVMRSYMEHKGFAKDQKVMD